MQVIEFQSADVEPDPCRKRNVWFHVLTTSSVRISDQLLFRTDRFLWEAEDSALF